MNFPSPITNIHYSLTLPFFAHFFPFIFRIFPSHTLQHSLYMIKTFPVLHYISLHFNSSYILFSCSSSENMSTDFSTNVSDHPINSLPSSPILCETTNRFPCPVRRICLNCNRFLDICQPPKPPPITYFEKKQRALACAELCEIKKTKNNAKKLVKAGIQHTIKHFFSKRKPPKCDSPFKKLNL